MDIQNAIATSDTFAGFNALLEPPKVTTTTNLSNLADQSLGSYNWYVPYCSHPQYNKTDKAYQVVRGLIRAKVIKVTTLGKFFEVMDEVVKVI